MAPRSTVRRSPGHLLSSLHRPRRHRAPRPPARQPHPGRRRRAHGRTAGVALAGALLLALLPLPHTVAVAARAAGPKSPPGSGPDRGGPATGRAENTPPRKEFEEHVLFDAAHEPRRGYACFRIPALVTTTRKTVLAFAEGRKHNCGDATDIDIVLKRSTDGGRTWGPLRIVGAGNGDTYGNPAPVVDRGTGRILLVTTSNRGRTDAESCAVPCERVPHLQYGGSDGTDWSRPSDLTVALRPRGWNSWYATGPGHGIQLAHGRHRGRLLVGVNAESHDGTRLTAGHAALVYSDDGGGHWRLGAVDTHPVAPDGTYRQRPSELTLAEREDGTVYVNGREQNGTDLGNRDEAVSRDGGRTFAAPFRALPDLYAPTVQGSVLPLGPDRWLFAAPADPDRRRTVTIRSSYDQGRTWEGVERGRTVTADWSGYSDMTSTGPGTVGLLYEAGRRDARQEIRFARFTEEWLGPRLGPGPTTPDLAPGARAAAVLGRPRPVDGRFGGGLRFAGGRSPGSRAGDSGPGEELERAEHTEGGGESAETPSAALAPATGGDAVRLPYRASLPLGAGDFTASLWFRYGAGPRRGEQPFLWMGGVGGAPQVALFGEPEAGRVTGRVTAVTGPGPARTAQVSVPGHYDDGRWHRMMLRRDDGRIVLTVDGASATATGVTGSVSRTSTFGVHLGQRPDGRAFLTGDLDEARVYRRALPAADPAPSGTSRDRPVDPRDTVMWLPLDRVEGAEGSEGGVEGAVR
ncbi:exo-alpha-sialidase [Streptomyces sp. AV19]|uniref:sialidase family protein n=1 Tax=Streptomyces sp. AV19 TaxID=2793068 RepID=UPI0018FEC3B3|nr:sialidase family protein [Streptomyces sp. AV19]MBH1938235.1 exo-alpha-sialidase [Streptomyces sp. AV19]MDG4534865.1 exo-alpha-sialidase [Streptomyces sp. AV19]